MLKMKKDPKKTWITRDEVLTWAAANGHDNDEWRDLFDIAWPLFSVDG
jgi:hypothetical protein